MPPGIPVATVGINSAKNAGVLAVSILGTLDKKLVRKIINYKKKLAKQVEEKAEKLEKIGYKQYLNESNKNSKS